MYNRILKRPMFKRGGMGYSAQGSGITSGMDTPRPRYYGGGTIGGGIIQGNPMGYRTGFAEPVGGVVEPELRSEADIQADILEVGKAPEGTWLDDVIGSFGVYASPYKEDGTAMTTGEMGAIQAEEITKIRKDRKDKEDLAKLTNLERELALRDKKSEQDFQLKELNLNNAAKMQLAKYEAGVQLQIAELAKQNTATGRRLSDNDALLEEELAAAAQIPNPNESAKAAAAAKAKHKKNRETIISGFDIEKEALKIAAGMVGPNSMKSAEEIAAEIIFIIKIIQQSFKSGGRVGYQMGTPQTGAMPVQQASLTETIDTPNADFTETETITEQQPTVQMPYEEFRAAIPPEVNDAIVQLIYYNQDAFADFSQITTQSDVYAFNNKYGVSLVLPMDTETT